jgi:cation-transporting P-type ATPase 13A2
MKFLAILGIIAVIAATNRIIDSVRSGQTLVNAVLSSLDLITIAVPPALPLILTVGVGFSLQRLKKNMIYCINPERLNYAGRLDTMCWDKTGTITVPQLQFDGVYKYPDSTEPLNFSEQSVIVQPMSLERVMTVCHGISRSGGKLCGHSLDLESFKQTGWDLSLDHPDSIRYHGLSLNVTAIVHPRNTTHNTIYLLQRYEFDAHLQRSSVISFSPNDSTPVLFTKGSPEAMKQICTPSSIPVDYDALCNQSSIEGYYVISCAARLCSINDLQNLQNQKRSQIEVDLTFIGFLLFRNLLKSAAKETFQQLKQANIKSIIITGDNALTAIHVARQLELCQSTLLIENMKNSLVVTQIQAERDDLHSPASPSVADYIAVQEVLQVLDQHVGSELCITGSAMNLLIQEDLEYLNQLMPHIRIFARTKPSDKTWIIDWLIRNGSYVGMCGDGTNDCGALKAAHVGLALSSAEASIVAPFTSAQKRIEDIVHVVKEGRCALETSFIGFKYMTLYPLIQLMMSATMNHFGGALSNNQFLFDDMCIVTILALFTLYTKPKATLSPSRPTDNLFSLEILMSILGQLSFCVFFFGLNVGLTLLQPWFCSIRKATEFLDINFKPIDPSLGAENYPCYPYFFIT